MHFDGDAFISYAHLDKPELVGRLKRVAVLIAVVSPRYIRSEWTRRELEEFWKAAEMPCIGATGS